jgi:mannitol/fructose-specific phosphotransferase system IIA component (Ntr-type)
VSQEPCLEFYVKAKYHELDCFIPVIASTDKWQVISELTGTLTDAGLVHDPDLAIHDLIDREQSLSTGMTQGLAIPHARTRSVSRRCVALGLSKEGLGFDSIDGLPAHVIFLELSPLRGVWPHLEYLADLARAYSNPVWRSELESCTNLARARKVLERMS